MRSMWTARSEPGYGVFVARSICTDPVFPLRRPISRRWPITASSISGQTSARGCAAFSVRPQWWRVLVIRVRCDGPGRRSTCATCLPTTHGAKAEPRQQPHSLSAEGHIRTRACSQFSGRAFGHRRLADGWPIVLGFPIRQLGCLRLCRDQSADCASVTGGSEHVRHVMAYSFFRRISRSSPNAVSIWHV